MAVRVKEPFSGFSHLAGLSLALVGLAWLAIRSGARDDRDAWGLVIYGASLVALYAASSAHHLVVAPARMTRVLRALDHLAIFGLIAGTCTPIFCRALDGRTRTAMLIGVWGAAVAGIALRVFWRRTPRPLYTALYVAMGWLVALRWKEVEQGLPATTLGLIVAGGVIYTLGAFVYAARRPDPFPRVFGFHEIWHLFVLGGSALHFAAIASLR